MPGSWLRYGEDVAHHRCALILVLATVLALSAGCSMRSFAVNTIGDMLASDESVFTADEDVELIGEALPFSIKLVESLLAESPQHRGLLLTAARSYVLYANAYVHFPAEQAAAVDIERARRLRARARKLYLRAFGYAMRGLDDSHSGISQALMQAPTEALACLGCAAQEDVPFLYWGAAAVGLAISVSKDDPAMLARLPEVEALLERALDLDEDYDDGALHEFAVVWAAAVPGRRDLGAIERHYTRALELSAGRRASLFVAYAMAVTVPAQNRAQFRSLMNKALAVDPEAVPDKRLLVTIAQRRARWLLGRIDELFLE
jgi:predicted anti-sigma-YlaC factor YlaD